MAETFTNRLIKSARILLGRQANDSTFTEFPGLTVEEVAEAQQFFPLGKFFILGHARSGTTVFVRLIRLHPEVHCDYQAHFFSRPPFLHSLVSSPQVGEWLKRGSNRWNRGRDLSPVVMRAAADYILERDARKVNKRIVGDKSPNNLTDGHAVDLMYKIYPDARLVYALRDGRDAVLSHRLQAFVDFPERLSREDLRIREDFTHHPEPYRCGERSLFAEGGLREAARGWARNVSQTCETGLELYGENFLVSRFEDLLAHPWEEMNRLWNFLGTNDIPQGLELEIKKELDQNPDADWQREKSGDIVGSVQKGRKGAWREMFTASDRQVFLQMAGETLEKWGYDTGET